MRTSASCRTGRTTGSSTTSREASRRNRLATPSATLESAATIGSSLRRRRLLLLLLLLLSQSVVSIKWMARLRRSIRATFTIRAVAGVLLVRGRSGGIRGWVFGRAVDGGSATHGSGGSSSACRANGAASTRWDGGRAAFVLAGDVLLGEFLLATALLVGLALAVFLLFLQLEGEGEVVVFLFAGAENMLLFTALRGRFQVRCWSGAGQWRRDLLGSIGNSQTSLLRRSFGSAVASWHCLPS